VKLKEKYGLGNQRAGCTSEKPTDNGLLNASFPHNFAEKFKFKFNFKTNDVDCGQGSYKLTDPLHLNKNSEWLSHGGNSAPLIESSGMTTCSSTTTYDRCEGRPNVREGFQVGHQIKRLTQDSVEELCKNGTGKVSHVV